MYTHWRRLIALVVLYNNCELSPPSVLCVVLVAGLWLAVSETLPTSKFCRVVADVSSISFGYSYYILLVSGLFSLGAASFNLLFARSAADRRRSVRTRFRFVSSYTYMYNYVVSVRYPV